MMLMLCAAAMVEHINAYARMDFMATGVPARVRTSLPVEYFDYGHIDFILDIGFCLLCLLSPFHFFYTVFSVKCLA